MGRRRLRSVALIVTIASGTPHAAPGRPASANAIRSNTRRNGSVRRAKGSVSPSTCSTTAALPRASPRKKPSAVSSDT